VEEHEQGYTEFQACQEKFYGGEFSGFSEIPGIRILTRIRLLRVQMCEWIEMTK
jgi:hypothetical protein